MRMFGSLLNRMMESAKQCQPKIGMGATIIMFTDRQACTIVDVISDKEIVVQRDTVTRIDNNGMSDCQNWKYDPNPNGEKYVFTLRKDGCWKQKKATTPYLLVGYRNEFYDFSF